ncbi:hypothetical protein BH10BDE1_BH10BDE1_25770 [soil metagenome]
MRVKKFEAKSMKDALRMVKAELGPDAVILGARENKRSFGLAGESSYEITAAVSESTLQKKRFVEARLRDDDKEKFRTSGASAQKRMIEKMVDRRLHTQQQEQNARVASARAQSLSERPRAITSVSYIDIQDEVPSQQVYARRPSQPQPRAAAARATSAQEMRAAPRVKTPVANAYASQGGLETVRSATPAVATKPSSDVRNRIRSLAREAWEAGRPVEPVKVVATAVAATPAPMVRQASDVQEIDSLRGEIQRLQGLLEGFQKVPQTFQGASHPGAEFGLGYDFSRSYQKLVETGVNNELAGEILLRASQEIDGMNAKKPSIVEAWVAKWFLQNISICARPLNGKMHVFAGPMGGGKTSQLVKTAAQLVIRDKKRIAVVSTDTTKVGAVDQLKIYCQILNVPFAVVRDKADWQWLEPQLQNVDHILVDSPGLALTAVDEIQRLRSLMPSSDSASVHLCLSSAMKEQDALEAVRRFRIVQPTDLVFTALDMSVQHGVIATVQLRSGLPLHSFGIGPRVPEDFEVATKERVLDLLFKLSSLKK